MQKVVIITAKAHPYLQERLEQQGYVVWYKPGILDTDLLEILPQVHGLVVTTRKVDAAMIDAATQLNWIARLGSGMEWIDTQYAALKNITCVSSPEGNCNAVAEHALGMLLALLNKFKIAMSQVEQHVWNRDENRGTELAGKTIGIIGYGNTGSHFAKLLSGFGVTVIANDTEKIGFANGYIKEGSVVQIQKYADVISFHLPLNPATRYFADDNFFKACANQPIILNTSRGNVVQTSALIDALQLGYVSGAGLDVLENEQLNVLSALEREQYDLLVSHPSVIVTPHIAGYSHEALLKMAKVVLDKLNL